MGKLHINDKNWYKLSILTSLDILRQAFSGVTLGVHNNLHTAGHGAVEGREELLLPAEDVPGAGDLLGEVVQVCSGLHTHDDLLELPPEVLNWVEL